MKFVADPNKFIFFIGLGIVGFLYIFLYMIFLKMQFIDVTLIKWEILNGITLFFAILIIRKSKVSHCVKD